MAFSWIPTALSDPCRYESGLVADESGRPPSRRCGTIQPVDRYGEFCALTLAAEILADRWTPLIVRELLAGHSRFNDLHR
jgi:hypothetical protein